MKVFVTGGTGYLGRTLAPELLRRGHDLRLLVRPAAVGTAPSPDDWPSVTPPDARDTASFVHYFREASGLDV